MEPTESSEMSFYAYSATSSESPQSDYSSKEEDKETFAKIILEKHPEYRSVLKACEEGHPDVAHNLAQYDGSLDKDLHSACRDHKFDTADWLIEKGADVNQMFGGKSLLSHFIIKGDCRVVKYLINMGADLNVRDLSVSRGSVTIRDGTPLHCAVLYNRVRAVQLLVEAKADLFPAPYTRHDSFPKTDARLSDMSRRRSRGSPMRIELVSPVSLSNRMDVNWYSRKEIREIFAKVMTEKERKKHFESKWPIRRFQESREQLIGKTFDKIRAVTDKL